MPRLHQWIILLLAPTLIACATFDGNIQERGLLYGHISSEKIVPVRVYIHQPGKMHWGPFGLTARVHNDGTFAITDVPPGHYYLGGISDGVTIYELSRLQGPLIEITPGMVGYLGSHRISGSSMARREGSPLDMQAQSRPDENELLRRLADRFENTEWHRPILRRLDQSLRNGQNNLRE